MRRIYSLLLSALLVFTIGGLSGCGGGSSECTPGKVELCPCAGEMTGSQTCNQEGSGFSACDCSSAPVGDVVNSGDEGASDAGTTPDMSNLEVPPECENMTCGENAKCYYEFGAPPYCECDWGLWGDGYNCIDACGAPTVPEKALAGCKELKHADLSCIYNAGCEDIEPPYYCLDNDKGNGSDKCIDLSSANLKNANLEGADLSEAILKDANLSGANLTKAMLWRTNLEGADLTNADLTGTKWYSTHCPDGTQSWQGVEGGDEGGCCGHLNGAVPSAGCD